MRVAVLAAILGTIFKVPLLDAQSPPGSPPRRAIATGSIAGIVRDSAGTPLRDASVLILAASSPKSWMVRLTDHVGAFRADSLAAGMYIVRYQLVGYRGRSDTVTVLSGRAATVTVALHVSPSVANMLGRDPAESDSSPVQLRFETQDGQPKGACTGIQLVETTPTSIMVTGFIGGADIPLTLHARAYRDGSGLVLDIIPQPQELIARVAACVEWHATISDLPTAVYTLNVREVQDPRFRAETLLIFNEVFDLRNPGTVMRVPPDGH